MLRLMAIALIVTAVAVPETDASSCIGLAAPVPGPIVSGFAPAGAYAGHWGIDLAVPAGTVVTAAAAGRVTFAGSVAGNRTVTVDHGGGLKTSYSYLDVASVSSGQTVATGRSIGRSGWTHGAPGLHFSTRINGVYVDPAGLLGCRAGGPGGAIWLAATNDS